MSKAIVLTAAATAATVIVFTIGIPLTSPQPENIQPTQAQNEVIAKEAAPEKAAPDTVDPGKNVIVPETNVVLASKSAVSDAPDPLPLGNWAGCSKTYSFGEDGEYSLYYGEFNLSNLAEQGKWDLVQGGIYLISHRVYEADVSARIRGEKMFCIDEDGEEKELKRM